jgi:putative inorganic carbon (HCO3(-)) transporter
VTGRDRSREIAAGAGVGLVVAGATAAPASWTIAALVTLGAAVAVAHADALLLVLVAALPWEGSLAWPTPQLNVVKLLGLLLLLAWVLRVLVDRDRVVAPAALVPALLVAMASLLALAVSPDPADGVLAVTRLALSVTFLLLVVQLVRTREQVRRVLEVFVAAAAAAALYGLYEFVLRGRDRAGGPIDDPNDFAFLLACTLPIAIWLAGSAPARRRVWQACAAMVGVGVVATLSRGALVGLLAVGVWGLLTRQLSAATIVRVVLVVLGVGLATSVLWGPQLQERLDAKDRVATENVSSRLALWGGALDMWADHPVLGVGPGRYGTEARTYVRGDPLALRDPLAHNAYLEALAETGAVGLAALLAFVATTWDLLARASRQAIADHDAEGAGLAAAMHGSLVVAVTAALFLSVTLSTPFWLVGALAVATAHAAPAGSPRTTTGTLAAA